MFRTKSTEMSNRVFAFAASLCLAAASIVAAQPAQPGGQPIDIALGGPLFADGADANEVIERLPPGDGYTASFLNFDVESQTVTVNRLHVAGTEAVTVPAGTFDCIKVEVASDDGAKTTLWVARDPRRVVRLSSTSPRMQGGTITAELQK
jgi:hypothetical protein